MSVIALLASTATIYGDHDKAWRQFVLDHRDEIRADSTVREIDPDVMAIVRGNMTRYLRDYAKTPADIEWIVFIINALPSNIEFVGVRELYVPDANVVARYYDMYQTSIAQD